MAAGTCADPPEHDVEVTGLRKLGVAVVRQEREGTTVQGAGGAGGPSDGQGVSDAQDAAQKDAAALAAACGLGVVGLGNDFA